MKLYLALILTLFYSNLIDSRATKALRPLIPSEEYTHSLVIDEDKPQQFQLLWKLVNNNEEIQFEAHCKTTGWLGVGLSTSGGMAGSDIAIGWVKNSKAYIKDCHATSKTTPQIDKVQNIDLIDGAEVDGYTILKFKRKLVTCDEKDDIEIKIGTQIMIFAWNDQDPETGNNDWKYHGAENRLPRTTMLLSFRNETIEQQNVMPSDTFSFDMNININVPAKDTYYFCEIFKLPDFTDAAHLIQFEMLINPKNKRHVHHLLAYECVDGYTNEKPFAGECGKVQVPDYVGQSCLHKMIIAWGIGGQYNYSFPKQAGYRFDRNDKPRYLLIEMHYDNPKLADNISDDSGLRLYFTKQLREHDLGLLQLGVDGNFISLQIPPKSNSFTFTSTCHPTCTNKYIPNEGIYAVSSLLHTHLAGKSVKTTLVRDGVAIKELFENPNYDFNYQFLMDIEPVKLQKGDALITQCVYDTNDRDKMTYFGFSTQEEMCYDFMYYYPRMTGIESCMTIAPGEVLLEFYNSLVKDGFLPSFELEAELVYYFGETIMEYFNNNVTMSAELTKRFEDFYASSYNRSIYCGDPTSEFIYEHNLPNYEPYKSEIVVSDECKKENENENGASFVKQSTVAVLLASLISLLF